MSPNAFEPDRSQPAPPADAESVPSAAGRDLHALQRIVSESVASLADDERLRIDDRSPLLAVVRRHAGVPFAPQPVGVELVEAVLIAFFRPRDSAEGGGWRKLAEHVSASLCENPAASERLERLWRRLQREVDRSAETREASDDPGAGK